MLAALVLAVFCAFSDSFFVPAAIAAYALALLAASGISPLSASVKVAPGLIFALILLLTLPFSTPGETVYSLGFLQITAEGLSLAMLLSLKAASALLAMLAMLGTSSLPDLAHALHHFHVPPKMVNIFFMSFRYFKTLEQEAARLSAAMKTRGFTPKTDMHTIKTYGNFIGMLLIRSLDRAERIRKAMLCRGFKDHVWLLGHFRFKKNDLFFCLHLTALIAILLWIRPCTT